MALVSQSSLFEPSGSGSLEGSADWISGVLLVDVAVVLCVLAVAAIGALLLFGRVLVRDGMRVLVGSFVVLGAPVIASGLLAGIDEQERLTGIAQPVVIEPVREGLSESKQDPYAGASLQH